MEIAKEKLVKKELIFDVSVTDVLDFILYFNNESIVRASKEELINGTRFMTSTPKKKIVEEINKKLGITDKKKYINGIKIFEKENVEILEKLYNEAKKIVEEKKAELIKKANTYFSELTGEEIVILKFSSDVYCYLKNIDNDIKQQVENLVFQKDEIKVLKESDVNKLNIEVKDFYWGDYTNETTYEVTINQLKEIIDISKNRLKEEKNRKDLAKLEKEKEEEQIKKDNYFYELESKVIETLETTSEDFGVKVEIKDKNTDEKRVYFCRNIFDFGYVVNLEKGGFASEGDSFDKKASKFLNAFPPISKSIRM